MELSFRRVSARSTAQSDVTAWGFSVAMITDYYHYRMPRTVPLNARLPSAFPLNIYCHQVILEDTNYQNSINWWAKFFKDEELTFIPHDDSRSNFLHVLTYFLTQRCPILSFLEFERNRLVKPIIINSYNGHHLEIYDLTTSIGLVTIGVEDLWYSLKQNFIYNFIVGLNYRSEAVLSNYLNRTPFPSITHSRKRKRGEE